MFSYQNVSCENIKHAQKQCNYCRFIHTDDKIVNVYVHEREYDRKVSYEMMNVVKDSGEGRCFL